MAQFRYTANGNYDFDKSELKYQDSINTEARTLDFGPGSAISGYSQYGDEFIYLIDGPEFESVFRSSGVTIQEVGLYGDSSDFDYVTRVTGGNFGDVFRTGDGDDVLNGGGGNDVLEGGGGANAFDGGTGTNTLSYEHFDMPGGSFGMIVDLSTGQASDWSTGTAVKDTFSNISNVRGSLYKDGVTGDNNSNVIEGGAGDDEMIGGGGLDTLSYAHSSESVNVDLDREFGIGGDAEDDQFTSFENILGSTFGDALYGDGGANTLYGNGGADELYGRGGDDRLVLSSSPAKVQGDEGTDLLFILTGNLVELTELSFTSSASIEKVYVRNQAALDMTGVDVGTKIYSQSQANGFSIITGTDSADRIVAGKGGDTLNGGQGGDALFAGAGANVFVFASGDGRDVIRRFEAGSDVIDVSMLASSMDGLKIGSFHGEANTIITFTGDSGPSDKIILLGVTADSVTEGSFVF
ncbi:calcium-binding protein [Methylobacterium sp. CM6241]